MILPFRGALSRVFAHRKLETKKKIICVKIINVLFLLPTDNRELFYLMIPRLQIKFKYPTFVLLQNNTADSGHKTSQAAEARIIVGNFAKPEAFCTEDTAEKITYNLGKTAKNCKN